jgi:hypothetical protein
MVMRRTAIVVFLTGCAAGLMWMFAAGAADDRLVGNANVVGGVAGIAALALAAVLLWPRQAEPVTAPRAEALASAVEYLAVETARYWRHQAKVRRITTPSPVAVRWRWADPAVAAPPGEPLSDLPTEGTVTRLREQLYEPAGGHAPERIVILGGPGAGKTTAMLLLLIDVLGHHRAGSAQAVPLWLTVGGWEPDTTSLLEWAAISLARDYPSIGAQAYGGPATATELLRTSRVALFIDGLDEMPDGLRGRAIRRLDEESSGMRVVLTCRSDEFTAVVAEQRLWGAAVVEVLPVDPERAGEFLLAEQVGDRRMAWEQVVRQLRHAPTSVVAQTLTSPLALSMARDAYAAQNPAKLLDSRNPDELLQHLIAQVLVIAYPDVAARERAVGWLSWVARRMGTGRDLRWWDMPTWMVGGPRALEVVLRIALIVAGTTAGGLVGWLEDGPVAGLTLGLLAGLAVSNRRGDPHSLRVRLPVVQEWRHLAIRIAKWLAAGILAGFVMGMGLQTGLVTSPPGGVVHGWVAALVVGPGSGLIIGLSSGLLKIWSRPVGKLNAISPDAVYRADRARTLTFAVTIGFGLGLIGVAAGILVGGIAGGLVGGVAGGVVGGLPLGLAVGRGPAGDLEVTGLCWWFCGRRVRLMAVLQTAAARQVLRQAGAIYQFRHAVLQDYLTTVGGDGRMLRAENEARAGTTTQAAACHRPTH